MTKLRLKHKIRTSLYRCTLSVGLARPCLIICYCGFQELISLFHTVSKFERAISKRRLLCSSVRYIGAMHTRTLRYPRTSRAMSCQFRLTTGTQPVILEFRPVNITKYVPSMVPHSHPSCMSWVDRHDHHHACPSDHFHTLIRCTIITSAPWTCHLSLNFNRANTFCLYKLNRTANYQRR
jgi:hypothetical protein